MNIIHIINLFRAYFIENKKTLLILGIITFGIATFGFTVSSYPSATPSIPYFFLLWIAGTFFQSSLKRSNSMHFFNLPTTTGEKFTHALIVILSAGIALRILAITGALTGHFLIRPLIYFESSSILSGMDILKMNIWSFSDYLVNAFVISGFLFGSIYFKKSALIKTFAITIGFLFGIAFYFVGLIYVVFGKSSLSDESINIDIANFVFLQNYYYLIPVVLALFFFSLTYLRLRETEV